jgi:outer membrane protein
MNWLATLLPVVMAVAPSPDSSARPVTLAEAIEMSRRNAPAAVQARGQVRTSAAGVRSAYAAFIPSVSVSAGATRQFDDEGGTRVENGQVITLPSEPWSFSAGLGASVTLFSGGNRFFQLRQAKADASAARANEILQRFGVDVSVQQDYFNVLAARETEAAARSQLEQAEQQLRAVLVRVRVNNATKSDSLRAEIQLRNAQLAIVDARNALSSAIASLTRATGSAEPVTAAADQPPAEAPLTLDGPALQAQVDEGPAVRQAKASLDAARAVRAGSWSDYLPTVSASFSRSGSASDAEFGFPTDEFRYNSSMRLSLSYPIFNQLGREEQVVRASVSAENAEAALRDARLGAREALVQLLGALTSADERLQAQAATVAAAEEDLRVQQQRYEVGGGTQLDVLTSQTQLNQAREALIRARYDVRISRAQLEALVGRDL